MAVKEKTYYRVADIVIAIEGNNKYADALRRYFQSEEIHNSRNLTVHLLVRVNAKVDVFEFDSEYYSLSGKIAFNKTQYRVQKKNFEYCVKNLFNKDEVTVLDIVWQKKASVSGYIMNHLHPGSVGAYSNAEKFVFSVMNYEVFWYIFAVILMEHGKIFVHSGIVSIKGKAIVIAGTGGCGKTSTLLRFMGMQDCRYIAEDFGVLSRDGVAAFTPKRIAVYQSDAKYKNEDILHALTKLRLVEKLFWQVFKTIGLNPQCRFEPLQFFGEARISKFSEIDKVIYMARTHGKTIIRNEIEEEQIVEKIMHASFRELRELYEILCNIRAVGNSDIRRAYPALEELQNDYKGLLREIVQRQKTFLMEVPLRVNPKDIVEKIIEE